MTIQITFEVNPTDYGKLADCTPTQGVEIANAIYNGFADPPNTAQVLIEPDVHEAGEGALTTNITFPYTAPEAAQ
jgi:hypothetical protein